MKRLSIGASKARPSEGQIERHGPLTVDDEGDVEVGPEDPAEGVSARSEEAARGALGGRTPEIGRIEQIDCPLAGVMGGSDEAAEKRPCEVRSPNRREAIETIGIETRNVPEWVEAGEQAFAEPLHREGEQRRVTRYDSRGHPVVERTGERRIDGEGCREAGTSRIGAATSRLGPVGGVEAREEERSGLGRWRKSANAFGAAANAGGLSS